MPTLALGAPGVVVPWCDVASVTNDERIKDVTLPDGVTVAMCVQAASEELFKAAGARWSGARTDTIRFRRVVEADGRGFIGWGWQDPGGWWNRGFPEGWGAGESSNELVLPSPITAITEVKIDGDVLDPAAYRVYDNRRLVLVRDAVTGAIPVWPCYQELGDATTEVGTMSITVQHGQAPPMAGQLAAREWSIQKVLLVSTNRTKLPQRTTRVQRPGVTVEIEGGDRLKDGLTGIPLVDTFLTFYNPGGAKRLKRRARSYSVDDVVPAISSTSQP